MGKERVLGEGSLAAVSSTQWGAAQDNRCLCSKNSWLCECFPRRNPNLQRARGRQQHVGCQRSWTGASQKAKQTYRQIGNVATRDLKEQVVKLHILLKDTLGLETGRARPAAQLASLQSQNAWTSLSRANHHSTATLVIPRPLQPALFLPVDLCSASKRMCHDSTPTSEPLLSFPGTEREVEPDGVRQGMPCFWSCH